MSCGFSSLPPWADTRSPAVAAGGSGTLDSGPPTSPATPNSGSTRLTAGSVPAAQSAKNDEIGASPDGCFSMIDGMIPVDGRSVK